MLFLLRNVDPLLAAERRLRRRSRWQERKQPRSSRAVERTAELGNLKRLEVLHPRTAVWTIRFHGLLAAAVGQRTNPRLDGLGQPGAAALRVRRQHVCITGIVRKPLVELR